MMKSDHFHLFLCGGITAQSSLHFELKLQDLDCDLFGRPPPPLPRCDDTLQKLSRKQTLSLVYEARPACNRAE